MKKRVFMYRTVLAQKAHAAILSYLKEPLSESEKEQVTLSIGALDVDSLLELSINGQSHLMDVLHLSFEIALSKESPIKCASLMDIILTKAHVLGNNILATILLQEDRSSFTPLHQALISGNPKILQIYLDEVRKAVNQGWISKQAYQNLLLIPNHPGFTPLHEALKSGNLQNMNAYFEEVRKAVNQGWISKQAYQNLLLMPNHAGFTPLHEALISGNPQNMKAYLEEVEKAVTEGWISKGTYKNLLLNPNNLGYTPLHQAANSNSIEVVNFFLNKLKIELSPQEYREALNKKTVNGYLPSCSRKDNAGRINQILDRERENRNQLFFNDKRWTDSVHNKEQKSTIKYELRR